MTALTTNPARRPGPLPLVMIGVVIAVLAVSGLMYDRISAPAAPRTGYSQFLTDVSAGGITRVVQTGNVLEVSGSRGTYTVEVPTILTDVYGDVDAAAAESGASTPPFEARPGPDTSWVGLVLATVVPLAVVLVIIAFVLLRIVLPTRVLGARSLAVRLRELDEAHASRLIGDEEWLRQRSRILDEA